VILLMIDPEHRVALELGQAGPAAGRGSPPPPCDTRRHAFRQDRSACGAISDGGSDVTAPSGATAAPAGGGPMPVESVAGGGATGLSRAGDGSFSIIVISVEVCLVDSGRGPRQRGLERIA
jgi:hypothetical protein